MGDWDWQDIHVVSGEWWIVVIFLVAILAGLVTGYWWGQRVERQRLYRPEPPPTDLIP